MTTENEKQPEESKVKRYSSLGQIVRAGDVEALLHYIKKFEEQDEIKGFLELKEGRVFNDLDELLWHSAEFKEQEKNLEIVEILIQYGANPKLKDNSGITLFMKAAGDNNVALMELLNKKFGVDLNEEDYGFHDVGYHIAQKDAVEALEFIVKLGYDINKQDIMGRTIFHFAAGIPAEKCVDKLIELNANPLIQDLSNEHAIVSQYVPSGSDWDDIFEKLENYSIDYQKKIEAEKVLDDSIGKLKM